MPQSKIRIAIDCMGGDYAPGEIVKGAIIGGREHLVGLQLVGLPDAIEQELSQIDTTGVDYEIVEATEMIEMGESPVVALRKKKNASIVVASKCVHKGESQGLVAAGNTGAAMAAAIFHIGRIKGIDRPAIAAILPTMADRPCILVDAGANADCIPEMLVQFARMGSIFMASVMGVSEPRVGLMNIGEEPSKGNSFTLSAYKLLENMDDINFVGNVEGKTLFEGMADVIVCDGFTGNITLKTPEGVANMVMHFIKEEFTRSLRAKAGALLVKSGLKAIKGKVKDEEMGGALLLGIKGICVIGHGGSNAHAVKNAIRLTRYAIEQDVIGKIESKVLEGCY